MTDGILVRIVVSPNAVEGCQLLRFLSSARQSDYLLKPIHADHPPHRLLEKQNRWNQCEQNSAHSRDKHTPGYMRCALRVCDRSGRQLTRCSFCALVTIAWCGRRKTRTNAGARPDSNWVWLRTSPPNYWESYRGFSYQWSGDPGEQPNDRITDIG